MNARVQGELVKLGLAAAEDVAEVVASDGTRATIERDEVNPRSRKLVGLDADGNPSGWTMITTVPADKSSVFYPADLPFLPGLTATFNFVSDDLRVAVWMEEDIQGFQERMEQLMANAKEEGVIGWSGVNKDELIKRAESGERTPPPGLEEWVRQNAAKLSDGDRQKLRDTWNSMQAPPETSARLDEYVDELVSWHERNGWSVTDEKETEMPFSSRTVTMRLGQEKRAVTRGGMFGMPQVMLMCGEMVK